MQNMVQDQTTDFFLLNYNNRDISSIKMNYQDFGEGLGEALVLVAEGGLLVSVGDQVLGVGIQEPVELLSANGIKGFLFKTLKKEQLQWHK